MKKSLILILTIALLALTGCLGFFEDEEQKPAAPEAAQSGELVTTEPGESEQPQLPAPPSFQDGDLYLQALATHDVSLCAKIGNESLKSRCEQNAPEAQ